MADLYRALERARELERELEARLRPVRPGKKSRATLYLIDDSGRVDPVPWVRWLVIVLAGLALVLATTTSVLVWVLVHGGASRIELIERLDAQEQTIQGLVNDREILMARMVLSGNTAGLDTGNGREPASGRGKNAEPGVGPQPEKSDDPPPPLGSGGVQLEKKGLDLSGHSPSRGASEMVHSVSEPALGAVAIEALRVSNDDGNGDLRVRFNIKNRSPDLATISGYVFVILKPAASSDPDWLVLPAVAIDRGKPALYSKGQYFSIAHFKPISFRVKSTLSPDAFNLATVVVYDGEGGLIFMQDIMLAETDG